MNRVKVGEIELCYDEQGDPAGEPMVLIHGLGSQLIGWDEGFCDMLGARGMRVVRYDNRDAGMSTILDDAPRFRPDAKWSDHVANASYTLNDMADDAVGLLAALDIESAHVVGVSLGAMIGQAVALRHPTRLRSLASIMATTGASDVGMPSPEAAEVLVRAPARGREAYIEGELANHRVIGSRGALVDEQWRRARYARLFDRGLHPAGAGRSLMAIFASGDRTGALAGVDVPTVVIHGDADTLIDVSGGRATAAAISGSELVVIPDMGHELPPAVWDEVVEAIVCNARRSGTRKGAR